MLIYGPWLKTGRLQAGVHCMVSLAGQLEILQARIRIMDLQLMKKIVVFEAFCDQSIGNMSL